MRPALRTLGRVGMTAVAVLTLGAGSGCAAGTRTSGDTSGRLEVVASFYPLEFVVTRIGGDAVDVRRLVKPGAEPHDLELSPRDVARLTSADLVVYLSTFQPAVDEAVGARANAIDVAPAARLLRAADGNRDPHFWLDPSRLADVAGAVADRMARLDREHAATFRSNAAALVHDLSVLDAELKDGLRDCRSRALVTSHAAFGYLAHRYGLTEHAISGLSPEAEPRPRTVAAVVDFVRNHDVSTIYYETLVSSDVARAVAADTGASVAVLDPIEGLTDASAGADYLAVMRSNLATLRAGQGCR